MLGERGAAKVTQASNAAGLDLGQSSEKGDGRKKHDRETLRVSLKRTRRFRRSFSGIFHNLGLY